MPARATTTSAASSSGSTASSRWRPATPTSVISSTPWPMASRVSWHSRATGRSEVPAATRVARRSVGARWRQVRVAPSAAVGASSSRARRWSSVARVATMASVPVSSSSDTMATHWSTVLWWQ